MWDCSVKNKNKIPPQVRKLKKLTILPAEIKPMYEISFKKDKVYGHFENDLLGRIGDIAVDDSGRVYVSDLQLEQIDVFRPDGTFLQKLGGKGRGPGEFGHIFDMKIQGDKLFAFDPTIYRINFYSVTSLAFDHVEGLFFQDWSDFKNIKEATLFPREINRIDTLLNK